MAPVMFPEMAIVMAMSCLQILIKWPLIGCRGVPQPGFRKPPMVLGFQLNDRIIRVIKRIIRIIPGMCLLLHCIIRFINHHQFVN